MSDSAPSAVVEEIIAPDLPAPAQAAISAGPYNFEFTGDDLLRLTVHNSQVGARVAVAYRFKRRSDGRIVSNEFAYTPSSDRAAGSFDFALSDGYLLNATAYETSGGARRGQTYARLRVMRGSGAPRPLGTIIQGYVTLNQDRAWPGSPLEGALEGDGYIRGIAGADPAAVSEIREVVPTGARWEVLSLHAILQTSALVGTRQPILDLYSGVSAEIYSCAVAGVGASQGGRFMWAQGMALESVMQTNFILSGIPSRCTLLAGGFIGTVTAGLQAGDDWGSVIYTVREWLEAQ